jgi:hypothetical protein
MSDDAKRLTWQEIQHERLKLTLGPRSDAMLAAIQELGTDLERRQLIATMAAQIAGPILARLDGRLEELDRKGEKGVDNPRRIVADVSVNAAEEILARLGL